MVASAEVEISAETSYTYTDTSVVDSSVETTYESEHSLAPRSIGKVLCTIFERTMDVPYSIGLRSKSRGLLSERITGVWEGVA